MSYIPPDNIYWLFSSSAQAISTFVAFLIAGYTFVSNSMDNAINDDESLEEVYKYLKRKYYSSTKVLVSITAFAILMSLLVVYLNGFSSNIVIQLKNIAITVAIVLNIASIYWGVTLVLSIIDPDKIDHAAKTLLKETKEEVQETGLLMPGEIFFKEFIQIEKTMRQIFENKDLYIDSKDHDKYNRPYTLSQMIESLKINELIDQSLFADLKEIVKLRNLIFHGHTEQVDEVIIKKVRMINNKLHNIQLTSHFS